ncbi:unnamed protein product [Rotaria sp. Silwood1]|nr:unnamed protein product [Rotaria sp. Silwood1]CAF1091354.1 unnamed protein product [Rotaria sp. Silwood1]CAF1096886.1 unnamed protein product [Rotaria sp. Silwood1]
MDITQKIDVQMLKNVTYKKLLPFMILERLLIIGQYPKNDVWRLYEIRARIYTLLQRPNENTNSLKNEHVNEEQRMIHSSSIISSSDNILVELVAE